MTPTGDGNVSMRVLMLTREYLPHVYGECADRVIAAERAAAFGRAGRRRVEAQFSWERIDREAIAAHRSASARYQPTLMARPGAAALSIRRSHRCVSVSLG